MKNLTIITRSNPTLRWDCEGCGDPLNHPEEEDFIYIECEIGGVGKYGYVHEALPCLTSYFDFLEEFENNQTGRE